MNNLIEVIFEEVPVANLGKFLQDLTKTGKHVKNCSWCAEAPLANDIDWQSESAITKALSRTFDGSLFITLDLLKIDHFKLPTVGVQVLHYEGKYDVGLNFEWPRVPSHLDLVKLLMRFSKSMAKKYGIENYFAGLEPAEELDTRWFTKQQRGPLMLALCVEPKESPFIGTRRSKRGFETRTTA